MNDEVSGWEKIRDRLRVLVRGYLDDRVSLLEFDHQPSMG